MPVLPIDKHVEEVKHRIEEIRNVDEAAEREIKTYRMYSYVLNLVSMGQLPCASCARLAKLALEVENL